ncbi:5'/3'-nucleotidase SurE [Motiliproteus sp. MSK22-1]|uniref:5'/3'-nucleotidase SurE n=1 Tax=Motiliproteus sp. MSK22-1 TaxID=1897630 RepID=UPI0009777A38|nr:5'/3'-nucleotidase SurE [Motiliproteus sp. MSK22-1]OMH39179.1 5'/3'-nucleotidase SurE [Motiliproteus sp. MSK22-1]
MSILISNDDGVHAKGLAVLAESLSRIAEVHVVAPDRNRSGASNSLTLDRPLEPQHLSNGFISINGTPTDCVHLGISGLFETAPEMVVAGINHGANLGDDVLYSGTVAAAMEGRYLRRPAIAVSLAGSLHFESAAEIALQLIQQVSQLNLAPRTVLNINVPDLPVEQIKGTHITRLGHRNLADQPVSSVDPRGKERFWIAGAGEPEDAGPGTDFYAVADGYVSITPLQADMTQYSGFDNLGAWLEGLE